MTHAGRGTGDAAAVAVLAGTVKGTEQSDGPTRVVDGVEP
jgi:hypothetical protein